ncbi:efflux RND transporter periplasmic adaptor subunit [Roseobacteraceae bacterium S113]
MRYPIFRSLLAVPPIAAAVMIVGWMNTQPKAQVQTQAEIAVPVRVGTLVPQSPTPRASGFGRVVATRTWSGVAEVEGRLTQYPDSLQVGAIVQAGALIAEIDPRDYEIAVAQAQADVLRAQASLEEIEVNADNTRASINIEAEILDILAADKARIDSLVERGSVATTELETASRSLLSQQSAVNSLNSTLALVTPNTLSSEASLAKAKADLDSAERNLARTRIVSPFSGRVTERGASEQQYVRSGEVLLSIEDTRSSEIEAEFQPTDLARLIGRLNVGQLSSLQPQDVTDTSFSQIFGSALKAEVIVQFGDGVSFRWDAQITRIVGQVDEDTGAVGIVVQVDGAGFGDPATQRPPLANGSFVEVQLSAPQSDEIILVPETAIRFEGTSPYVFTVGPDSRLVRKDIVLATAYGNQVHVQDGLDAGTQVVLSNPSPATPGLLLQAVEAAK